MWYNQSDIFNIKESLCFNFKNSVNCSWNSSVSLLKFVLQYTVPSNFLRNGLSIEKVFSDLVSRSLMATLSSRSLSTARQSRSLVTQFRRCTAVLHGCVYHALLFSKAMCTVCRGLKKTGVFYDTPFSQSMLITVLYTDKSQWTNAKYDDVNFFRLKNTELCLWAILDEYIPHVILTCSKS